MSGSEAFQCNPRAVSRGEEGLRLHGRASTRLKLTRCSFRVRRICRKSGFGVPGRDAQYGIDVLLKRCQTLGRCELEHPTNQREIDTVFGISGPWRRSIREIADQDPVLLPTRSDATAALYRPSNTGPRHAPPCVLR